MSEDFSDYYLDLGRAIVNMDNNVPDIPPMIRLNFLELLKWINAELE